MIKEKRHWEESVYWATVGETPVEPLERASLRIVRHSSGPEPDFDNLVQGGKFLADGLVKAGVLADDKPSVVPVREYLWEKCKRGEGRVCISVEEIRENQE